MDKELFKKTEGRLYRYFKYKKEIYNLIRRVEFIEKQIKDIDNSIRNVHKYIHVDPYQNGSGISERVQTSTTGTSYIESEMEREVTKLEKEQCNKIKNMHKLKVKIRERESYIKSTEINIEMLSEEDKKFIEYKYEKCKSVSYIAIELNMALATAYRKREDLIQNIAIFISLIK